jgi:hypothetical protein
VAAALALGVAATNASLVLPYFLNFFFLGFGVSVLVSKTLHRNLNSKMLLRAFALGLPLLYYWGRTSAGDLDEVLIMRPLPWGIKFLMGFFAFHGLTHAWSGRITRVAYSLYIFLILMRTQGQIVLSYLLGYFWIPTRDNYTIDFALSILFAGGAAAFAQAMRQHFKIRLASGVPIALVLLVGVTSLWNNPYYVHWVAMRSSPDHPHYMDPPSTRAIVENFKNDRQWRYFLINKPTFSMTFGFPSSLFQQVGQVTHYDSLVPKNYKDWTLFQRLGVKPRPNSDWEAYSSAFTPATNELLQIRVPEFEIPGWDRYFYTMIARPAIETNALKLLGVKWLVFFEKSVADPAIEPFDLKSTLTIDSLVSRVKPEKVERHSQSGYYFRGSSGTLPDGNPYFDETIDVVHLTDPLPRAISIPRDGLTQSALIENRVPTVSGRSIQIDSTTLSYHEERITYFQPKEVRVSVTSSRDSYLILSDLFHKNWRAEVDGRAVDILPAFSILRAVPIGPGVHVVRFYYHDPMVFLTLSISLAAILIGILGLTIRPRRRA